MSPPGPYVEILSPEVMVSGGRVFGMWLGNEGRAIMIGISALVKEAVESSRALSALGVYGEKAI